MLAKQVHWYQCPIVKTMMIVIAIWLCVTPVAAVEFNSGGGTNATNGLHFYIDKSTQLQVRRLNNTGQVYHPGRVPPNRYLDNGIYLRANGRIYGPDHFAFNPYQYSTESISAVSPANPAPAGTPQTATSQFGLNNGPQVSVQWKYVAPFDFITAQVSLAIPNGYAVGRSNPVRYYHAIDNYLGGSDNGCGIKYTDADGKLVIGTYPPPSGRRCPSSNSVPNGVAVVESFRERDGLGFSHYCVDRWNRFWSTSRRFPQGCSIANTNDLSDNISTVYQDTGMAIEYAFHSAGTYTFSYDFVVGSTQVPIYDHVEIRHPGNMTLCPVDVTVLACTVSTVPCPAANIVNTGVLNGRVQTSPSSPNVATSPSSFTLDSVHTTATVNLQANAAGTVNLYANNLSAIPLNGTRCFNTTNNSTSCQLNISNSPCVSSFECLGTSQAYQNLQAAPSHRNPLLTQVTGTPFVFDIVAIDDNGNQASSYAANNLLVELFDDHQSPKPACASYRNPVNTQLINMDSGDAGRKRLTTAMTLNRAYRQLRCRVTDTSLAIAGCSSDVFAVRPNRFTIASTVSADVTGTDAGANPVVKTGATFTLSANTSTAGYDGVPSIDINQLLAHVGSVRAGSVTGTFNTANKATGNAQGTSFRYDEVGYFRFGENGVYDDTFTLVDSASGDCAAGFTASGGKHACYFGNTSATDFFGRFIPDHFAIAAGTTVPACGASFSYYGQDGFTTPFTLTAQNAANQTTQNYTGNYARFDLADWSLYAFTANPLPTGVALQSSSVSPTGTWGDGFATVQAQHLLSRPTSPVNPSTISIHAAPLDADGVTMSSSLIATPSGFRYGRLFTQNQYGSELLDMPVSFEAQYWNGMSYQRNQLDSCSSLLPNNITMSAYTGNLNACETSLSGGGASNAGLWRFNLNKPGAGNGGSVQLSVNLTTAVGNACTPTSTPADAALMPWFGTTNPNQVSTFGLYKSPMIYMRENF